MELRAIIQANLDFVKASGVTVEVNASQEWVSITDTSGGTVFMQGWEASEFIDKARATFENLGDLSMDEAYLAEAYDYLDLL